MESFQELGTIHQNGPICLKVVRPSSLSRTHTTTADSGVYVLKSLVVEDSSVSALSREWAILSKIGTPPSSSRNRSRVNTLSDCSASNRYVVKGLEFWNEVSSDFKREYLLMEAVIGGPLHRHIQFHGQIPTYRARIYSFEIASALIYLHEVLHCVHRDLKASNILLDHRGHIKIADFGSAKILSKTNDNCERSYTIIGTIHCMAPEMVARTVGYDYSVDYWAFGVLIYEMLTGHPPKFTWHSNGIHETDSKANFKRQFICSEMECQFARSVIDAPTSSPSSAWHFDLVDELLEYYPNPPPPRGDILNNIKTIELRLAFEEVQLSHDLIKHLLTIRPASRLKVNSTTLTQYPWMKQGRLEENSDQFESVDFDQRLGLKDILEAQSCYENNKNVSHQSEDCGGDLFSGF